MSRLSAVLGIVAVVALAAPRAEAKTIILAVDGALNIPTGDWADVSGMGIGALLEGKMAVGEKMNVTGRIGYIYGLGKERSGFDYSWGHIPILAGIQYFPTELFYLAAEAGFVNNRVSVDTDMEYGGDDDDSDTDLGFTLGAGCLVGGLDLRGQLFFPDSDETDDMMGLLFTVGYTFSSL